MLLTKEKLQALLGDHHQTVGPYVDALIQYYDTAAHCVENRFKHLETMEIIIFTIVITVCITWLWRFLFKPNKSLSSRFKRSFFRTVRRLPFVKQKIAEELGKNNEGFLKQFHGSTRDLGYVQSLPSQGWTKEDILSQLKKYKDLETVKWQSGRLSGAVYGGEDDVTDLMATVYSMFAMSNPLFSDVFPDIRKMEAEVVRMACNMFNGSEKTCGTMTSGGTESIMLACLAYRNIAYEKGVEYPEMVLPLSAHAAFNKASDAFNIKIVYVPFDAKTGKANVQAMKKATNSNTCMLVASAPGYAQGIIDPIADISKLGEQYSIPVHLDCCLGGFMLPFMEKAGFDVEPFDFRLPGITSISADPHKYGFAPKGSSLILYRDQYYRKFQFFTYPYWTGGIFGTPTFAGSRSGAVIAATWATLMYIGESGYIRSTKKIISTARYIADSLRKIPELVVYGEPLTSIVSMGSERFNILNLLDKMTEKGWALKALQYPTGVHICLTLAHTQEGVADQFIEDCRTSVTEILKENKPKEGGQAAIYGMTQSIPDSSIVEEVVSSYYDAYYNTDKKEITKAA